MRIRFDHPAVVTGTWENGHVRRELVRVSTDFEVKEYSDAEAPRSFTVVDDAAGTSREFRTVGGRHYKKWCLDKPEDTFYPGSNILNSIYTGKQLDFPSLTDILNAEIAQARQQSRYRDIENTERHVLKRELTLGLDSRAVALMKAPHLKGWRWLGPDTEAEVADWRNRTAEVFGKIIMVDGCPHVLSYEPCYRLNASGTTTRTRRGPARMFTSTVAVYGDHLKGRSIETDTGFENLGYLALLLGDQFFAANDRDGLTQFAEASGWGLSEGRGETIVVHDADVASTDFLELETVRHARIIYDRAGLMVRHIRKVDNVEQYSGRPIEKAVMLENMENLRQAILEWQAERNGTEGLAAPFEDLLTEMIGWENGNQKINEFDLLDQVKAFKIREDMADVTIIPVPWSAPAANPQFKR